MNDLSGHIEPVYEFEGGPIPMHYIVRGHVDKTDFVNALHTEYQRDAPIDAVRHTFWRNVPYAGTSDMFAVECERGRGATPLTVIDYEQTYKIGAVIRVRFFANFDDPRPMHWPVKHPYWITGYAGDESYATVVSYADNIQYIYENWPEAKNLDVQEVNGYAFTDRFPVPDWFQAQTT